METKYSFSKKNEFFNEKKDISIFELENFKIDNGKNIKHFNGVYFPVRYSTNYSILLYDYIGVYLMLKNKYPDLKIIFFKKDDQSYSNNQFSATSNDFVKYFQSEIIEIDKNSFSFDKILVTEGDLTVIPSKIFSSPFWKYTELSEPVKYWWFDSLKIINETFNNKLVKQDNTKLYMTRSLSNKEYLKNKDPWSIMRSHDTIFDDNLDNAMKNNNYQVIEGIGKGFFEQATLAYNSKIFVTIEGSAMFNAIWCKENTPIVMIKNKKKYQFYYPEMFNFLNKKNFFTIDVCDIAKDDVIDFIINKLYVIEKENKIN